MNVMKAKLLMAALLATTVATVGCSPDLSVSKSSLERPRMSNYGDQTSEKATEKATHAGETASAQMVSKSEIQGTKEQSAASPTGAIAQASYNQPIQPASKSSPLTPLTTLGPDDDLLTLVDQASGVVLLDFYADWCGPCRTQGGILHEMEDTASQNNAAIIKVDVDQHRQLARALNITSLPTLMLIKDGEVIDRQIGLADHERVAALLSL